MIWCNLGDRIAHRPSVGRYTYPSIEARGSPRRPVWKFADFVLVSSLSVRRESRRIGSAPAAHITACTRKGGGEGIVEVVIVVVTVVVVLVIVLVVVVVVVVWVLSAVGSRG